jgi:tRNA uridine 5-carboxymethylaminomethyl modification enzyme
MDKEFEVIVIGAGHAGAEAGLAAARMGLKTAVFTLSAESVAFMACNPSIGGTGKGHLVREIDALGGEMALAADRALLQIRMLNRGKGPAVFSLRGQEDKRRYHLLMRATLESQKNLRLIEDEAEEILVKNGEVIGVRAKLGGEYRAKAVVVAAGVYLKSRIVVGDKQKAEGPAGFPPANSLTASLAALGLNIMRFKTGTPARIDKKSIDFSKMTAQEGEPISRFSFLTKEKLFEQTPCYLTYTNERTHKIIKDNISRSPMFNGIIEGVGARYCPSIESKVMLFDRDRHQVFVEPEGADTEEMYVQGMSTSLPEDVQEEMYKSVAGLENVKILRYAYAIEYDCIDSRALYPTYQVKHIQGLYTAGQVNGSSGYEEAAAQGLMAGINAALYLKGEPPLVLPRSLAYIGVLTDDLVTKGTNEPYRMMTARAEYRIMLRQDNADLRLTEFSARTGLISDERLRLVEEKKKNISRLFSISETRLAKEKQEKAFSERGLTPPERPITFAEAIKRLNLDFSETRELLDLDWTDDNALETAVNEIKYRGYIKKEEAKIKEQQRLEEKLIPEDIDYRSLSGLRTEAREKLQKIRPRSIGQAGRISGVSPADIAVLLVYLRNN